MLRGLSRSKELGWWSTHSGRSSSCSSTSGTSCAWISCGSDPVRVPSLVLVINDNLNTNPMWLSVIAYEDWYIPNWWQGCMLIIVI
jgi:hypothetical protein